MDCIAVAVLYERDKETGIRVVDLTDFSIYDVSKNNIGKLLDSGTNIRNLALQGDEIVLLGGKPKYPIFNKKTNKIKQNEKAATIIAKNNIQNVTEYIIVDGNGDFYYVSEQGLLEVIDKGYTLTNAEIIGNGENRRISLLHDILDCGGNEYKLLYDRHKGLTVVIYSKYMKRLIIPSSISDKKVDNLRIITVKPEKFLNNIEEVHVYADASFGPRFFGKLTGLKRVEFRNTSRNKSNYWLIFSKCKNIESLYFDIDPFYRRCENMDSLKRVEFGPKVSVIHPNSFENCKNLEEVIFDKSNIMVIDSEAFRNCKSLRRIVFPSTLRSIAFDSFAGCDNLEEVVFNSPVCVYGVKDNFGNMSYSNIGDESAAKIFEHSKNVKIYCNGDFPIKHLKWRTYDNVSIIADNRNDDKKQKTEHKLKLLGGSNIIDNIPSKREELSLALRVIDDGKFHDSMVNEFKLYFKYLSTYGTTNINRLWGFRSYVNIVTDGIFFIPVDFSGFNKLVHFSQIKSIGYGNKYIVISLNDRSTIVILCIDKNKLIGYLDYYGDLALNMDKRTEKPLIIPVVKYQIHDKIANIKEVDDYVVVTDDKGNKFKFYWNIYLYKDGKKI